MQATFIRVCTPAHQKIPSSSRGQSSKLNVVSRHTATVSETPSCDRRRSLSLLLLPALLFARPAKALYQDPKKLLREKEERKAKLKEAAEKMKKEGRTTAVFGDSDYSLPEEATTPNMRNVAGDRAQEKRD